jgi:hypothetical protein
MMIPEKKREKYARELDEKGIVVIENYLDTETCESIYEEIMAQINQDKLKRAEEFEDANQGYNAMANAGEPVLHERTGADEGMLDIFNMQMAVEELNEIEDDDSIEDIINRITDSQYGPTNTNTYIRRGVGLPAPYHADSFTTFKTFVYLTDVPDTSYGPFSYVPGSHKPPLIEKFGTKLINTLKGNSGAPRGIVPDISEARHVTGNKGTLIIANQGGYHRALPQSEGKERVLVTTRYKPPDEEVDFVEGAATKLGKLFS